MILTIDPISLCIGIAAGAFLGKRARILWDKFRARSGS